MSGIYGGWLTRALATLAVFFAAALLTAPSVHAEARIKPTPCILAASMGSTPAALFADPGAFECRAKQTQLGRGDFWVLMHDIAATSTPMAPLALRTASVWQDAVTLHILYADGHIARTETTSATTSRQLQLGAIIQYDIPPRAVPVTAILAFVRGSANVRGVLLSPEIVPASAAARSNLVLAALYAGFLGLSVALLCYNFALWTVLRRRFQLAYCAMLVAMIAYVFSSSGALAWAWPAIDNNDRLRINYATLTLVVVGALLFSRHFFEARILPRTVIRLVRGASAAAITATAALILLAPWEFTLLDTLNSIATAILLLSTVPIMIFAWIRRSRFAHIFALTWFVPFVLALARVASNMGLIGQSFWIDNSTVLAMSIEALLSAVAIAFRIRLLSDERDRARADESIARLLADTDPLTSLLNRRAFLTAAIGSKENQRLLLIDIDGFKQVNDRIGHDGGDEVLRVFARTLRASAPRDALVARIGGEEFALVAPAAAAGTLLPATLLDNIRAAHMPTGIVVTASIGVAEGTLATEQDWTVLYRSADRALYRAKHDGRDRAYNAAALASVA